MIPSFGLILFLSLRHRGSVMHELRSYYSGGIGRAVKEALGVRS